MPTIRMACRWARRAGEGVMKVERSVLPLPCHQEQFVLLVYRGTAEKKNKSCMSCSTHGFTLLRSKHPISRVLKRYLGTLRGLWERIAFERRVASKTSPPTAGPSACDCLTVPRALWLAVRQAGYTGSRWIQQPEKHPALLSAGKSVCRVPRPVVRFLLTSGLASAACSTWASSSQANSV